MRLRNLGIFAAIAIGSAVFAGAASAQGFFDFFFGRRPSPPPQAQSYAPFDYNDGQVERRSESAPAAAYCVRLCDGRYFPLPRNAGKAAETCNSFCPTAKTKVFSGSGIDHAVATDGKRYADLENAFAYRDKVVNNCTCNGKTAFGLARVNVAEDPTLRPGDIVATSGGMVTYNGGRRGVAQFTPIDKSRVSSEMRSRLANMRIQPEYNGEDAMQVETSGAASADEKREKRTQR